MKSKIFLMGVVFFILIVNLSAKSTIKNIEFFSGDSQAQLYFKTDGIITMPDIFYPDEKDPKFMVMRVAEVNLELKKNVFTFNSTVVDSINVKSNPEYIDFEIKLKEKVNYRLYTKDDGLYIEFPEIMKTMTNADSALEKKSNEVDKSPELIQSQSNNRVTLKDIKLINKQNQLVTFIVELSDKVEYEVIPVPENPVRLAIDLKNTQAKSIKKMIDFLNVKSIRGAKNTENVYRLVFDLLYLKNYKVTPVNNSLEVTFSNSEISQDIQPTIAAVNQKKTVNENTENSEKSSNTPANSMNSSVNLADNTVENLSKATVEEKETEFFEKGKSRVPENQANPEFLRYDEETVNPNTLSFAKQTISSGEKQWSGEPMTFNFYEMELKNVLLFIAKFAGLSLVLDPEVSGKITCNMTDIPWDQALDYFLKINGLDMTLEGRLLRIAKVDKLSREAEERRKKREAMNLQGELEVAIRPLSYTDVTQIAPLLQKQMSPRGEILSDKRSNTLIISDLPARIKIVDALITRLDTPILQVSIEARIVETFTNYTKNLGIQWGYGLIADSAYGNQTTLKFPNSVRVIGNQFASESLPAAGSLGGYAVNFPASGAATGTTFSLGNIANTFRLDVALSAMETQGKGKIISSPKTVTQNNQEAYINTGKQIPIQVVQNNTITVQYRNAALELKVKPQITAEGTVVVAIDLKNNYPDFANLVNGIPPITTQEISTTVKIDDGGTIVIGGVFKIDDSKSSDSVPFFSKLPIIGTIFKNSSKKIEQKELLVFITPRIIK